ncbi:hypothetical protein F2Q68_00041396 [Brassica cretica]|uniref:Uncharacterized protein n=1 Tax=Brassica cretica TaxID=69181 RepID=A0A8S9MN10_BRACR|nr:hypothetical protein F2Q68_00041396 [Brassica cretica]
MRTAFSLPAGRTAKSYVAIGAGLDRGLGTAGYGGLTRKDPPDIETAAGRATAARVVPIAIPSHNKGRQSEVVKACGPIMQFTTEFNIHRLGLG